MVVGHMAPVQVNGKVPCGIHSLANAIEKNLESTRFDRTTSHRASDLAGSGLPTHPSLELVSHMVSLIYILQYMSVR